MHHTAHSLQQRWLAPVPNSRLPGTTPPRARRLMRFMRVIRLLKRLLSNVIYASISFEGRWLSWFKGQSFLYLVYIV